MLDVRIAESVPSLTPASLRERREYILNDKRALKKVKVVRRIKTLEGGPTLPVVNTFLHSNHHHGSDVLVIIATIAIELFRKTSLPAVLKTCPS